MSADAPAPMVLAYLAGALDADGHITLVRSLRTKGKQYAHRPTYYLPRIGFTSTSPIVADLFKATLGGRVYQWQPKNPKHKRVYIWAVQSAEAGRVALILRPLLRTKAEQARLLAECCDVITAQHTEQMATQKPPYRITPEQLAVRAEFWEAIGVLNQPSNRRVHPGAGREAAGRLLDGVLHDAMPESANAL